LAVGSASQVNLWDLQSKKIIATAGEGESDSPASLAFSPDGNILAEAGWNTVKVWEVKADRSTP
jgi:WD40 repeat protein